MYHAFGNILLYPACSDSVPPLSAEGAAPKIEVVQTDIKYEAFVEAIRIACLCVCKGLYLLPRLA